jgi:hypothetical protein
VSSPPTDISPEQWDACRAFPRAVPALMDNLGMPPGANWRKVTLDGPITKGSESVTIFTQRAEHVGGHPLPTSLLLPDWEGYTFELFGCIPDDPSGRENWPGWEIDDDILQIWLQLAYVPGAPVLARIEWHPNTGILSSLQIIRDDWSDDDLSKAGRGLRLLQGLKDRLTRRGRHREYDQANELQLLQELSAAIHALVEQGERASYASVARKLGRSRTSIKIWVENSPWDLQAIEREALRCTGPLRVNLCAFSVRHAADYRRKGV